MKDVIIIAEAGVNHNGILDNALSLIDCAADAGADFIKFQTFKAEKIVSAKAKKADYQIKNLSDEFDTQFQMLKSLEIPVDWYEKLLTRCDQKNIKFLSTGFDEESIDFLENIGIPFFKIPSGEITNKPYLRHVAKKGKKVVISTGMANIDEIRRAVQIFRQEGFGYDSIMVLHCNTEYPTPMHDVNLLAMNHIANELKLEVGYSDHTLGIEVSIAAVALGARLIEKHFTLDRNMLGPDHKASLEPNELKQMVRAIRNIQLAIGGSSIKEPSPSEIKNISAARKSIHISMDLASGHILKACDLISLRPGNGISPMDIDNIVGKMLVKDLSEGSMLTNNDFK